MRFLLGSDESGKACEQQGSSLKNEENLVRIRNLFNHGASEVTNWNIVPKKQKFIT
jgi:hypothetical protein